MRVALDIRRLGAFGVGTYVRNIVRGLGQLDTANDEFILIGPRERLGEFDPLPANFRTEPFAHEPPSPRYYLDFHALLKRQGCDLLHVPYLFWRPLWTPCPYVMTVHDLLSFFSPVARKQSVRTRMQQALTTRALRKAARIFAVSHFTRSEVVRLHRVPAQKIQVIYNAIDERLQRGHASDADRQLIAERYQVTYPFLLYAGNIKPHKNLVRTIEAFSALKAELEKDGLLPDLKLIIIGDELSRHADLRRTCVRGGVQNDVRFLGFVPIDVLRIFYDAAKVFLFPSLYEGFGLPPLEAMAHGTPVVTSNLSSLPEVVGNAAVLVNPENVFDIMRAIYRVLLDQPLRERLKARGYEQVQRYSWRSSCEQLLTVYREVAGS